MAPSITQVINVRTPAARRQLAKTTVDLYVHMKPAIHPQTLTTAITESVTYSFCCSLCDTPESLLSIFMAMDLSPVQRWAMPPSASLSTAYSSGSQV
jgi:hypothetical protein